MSQMKVSGWAWGKSCFKRRGINHWGSLATSAVYDYRDNFSVWTLELYICLLGYS